MTLVLVPATGYAQPLVMAGDGPSLVINRDLTTPLIVGKDNSVTSKGATGDISLIDPLGSMRFNGLSNVFGIASTTNINGGPGNSPITVVIEAGADNWIASPAQVSAQLNALGLAKDSSVNNPAYQPITLTNAGLLSKDATVGALTSGGTIANEVAVAGAPLLHKHVSLTGQSNLSVTSTVQTFGPFTMTQPGYQVFFSLFMAAQQNSYLRIEFKWFDSSSGIQIDDQTYFVVPGTDSSANLHTLVGSGPTSGNQLTVSLSLVGTAGTITVPNFLLFQNSRALLPAKHIWKTWAFANLSINGGPATFVGADPKGNLLGLWSVSVPAAGSLSFYPPLYTGAVTVYVLTASGTSDCQVNVNALADTVFGTGQRIAQFQTDSHGVALIQQFALPRSQVQFTMNNGNAAAKSINLVLQSSVTE